MTDLWRIVTVVLLIACQALAGAHPAGAQQQFANPLPEDLKGAEPVLLDAPPAPTAPVWYYAARPTDLLDSPSILANTIARLGVGERVSFAQGEIQGAFMLVRTPAGLEGWAARGNLVLMR